MADATDLGTIYSFGQRRAPGGTFPSPGGAGGGGGPPDIIGVEPEEVEPNPEPPPTHPCDDPETALDWNADAAAAAAAKGLKAFAATTRPSEANFDTVNMGRRCGSWLTGGLCMGQWHLEK